MPYVKKKDVYLADDEKMFCVLISFPTKKEALYCIENGLRIPYMSYISKGLTKKDIMMLL